MKKQLQLLWIDDEPKRETEAENLEKRLNIDVVFRDVKHKKLQDELQDVLSGKMPDLILMDHKLADVEKDGFRTGSTAAEVIREQWAECPIICVTGVSLKDVDFHQKFIYEDVFDIAQLSQYDSSLVAIAESFKSLQGNRPQNTNDLIERLGTPDDDKIRLRDVIPSNLKKMDDYEGAGSLLAISRWVRHVLMEKPGFLYDRLWTATLLGVNEESFKKVESFFDDAKYTGIFASDKNERWWQTKVRESLFSMFPDSDIALPWVLGRELPGIAEDDFSKCHASGEYFPETVAFTDETSKKRAPMRLRYTVPHPHFEKSLYFEEIRMMKGAE